MGQDLQDIIPVVRRYIIDELLERDVPIADETPLIHGGYLASLQTLELVGFINDTFGIEIEPEEVNEEEFHSLASIAALIQRKKAA